MKICPSPIDSSPVGFAPVRHDVGNLRDLGAEDEREPGLLDRFLVRVRDHPGVGDDRDVSQLMGGHERGDRGQHGRGLGLVALQRLDRQREPGPVGEQADSDLRLQAAFLGEAGLAEPVPGIGLEIQRGHVEQHQAGWSEPGVRGAGRGQLLAPPGFGIDRQPTLDRAIRHRLEAGLGQHPQAVLLAGRFDDPRQHQVPEDLVSAGGLGEPERVLGTAQRPPTGVPSATRRSPTRRPRQRPQPAPDRARPARQRSAGGPQP